METYYGYFTRVGQVLENYLQMSFADLKVGGLYVILQARQEPPEPNEFYWGWVALVLSQWRRIMVISPESVRYLNLRQIGHVVLVRVPANYLQMSFADLKVGGLYVILQARQEPPEPNVYHNGDVLWLFHQSRSGT
jgi:hypothetical protein